MKMQEWADDLIAQHMEISNNIREYVPMRLIGMSSWQMIELRKYGYALTDGDRIRPRFKTFNKKRRRK